MRKEIKVIAAAVLGAIVLTGCGGNVKDPTGYYELSKVVEGDKTVESTSLDEYGLDDAYAVFESEDSGYFVLFGVPRFFNVDSGEGVLRVDDGGSITYSVSKKELVVSDSKISLTFEKSPAQEPEMPDVTFDKTDAANYKELIHIGDEE